EALGSMIHRAGAAYDLVQVHRKGAAAGKPAIDVIIACRIIPRVVGPVSAGKEGEHIICPEEKHLPQVVMRAELVLRNAIGAISELLALECRVLKVNVGRCSLP